MISWSRCSTPATIGTAIREPFVVATENDALNGVCMLLGKLLTNTASGFADVRTYWSPEAVERVTGWKPEGMAANGFIHLINSAAVTLARHRPVRNRRQACHEALVGHHL